MNEGQTQRMNRLCVYTAITGQYDDLIDPPESCWSGADFVAFVERSNISHRWSIKPLVRQFSDPCRDAKIYKILPDRFLAEYGFSLWVDGSIEFAMPFSVFYMIHMLGDADLAILAHPTRTCLYQEACRCIHLRLDRRRIIQRQIERYTKEGYPPNNGLAEASVILRRHNSRVKEFNKMWWEEIVAGSRRDQLSFNYVAWKCNLKLIYFPESLSAGGSFFRRRIHRGARSCCER